MKRVFALLLATLLSVTALGGCGHPDLNMDRYQYDGYQNVQWGSTPEDVVSQLGLSKKQVDRLEPSKMDEGLPEGTFGYEVTKTCMLFGMFIETRLYFAESLYGMDQYSGLYGMKIVFNEIPEYYKRPAGTAPDDDSYYRLDPQAVIDEYDLRGVYNVNKTTGTWEDEHGSWKTVTWSCDATLSDLPADADTVAIDAAIEKVRETLGDEAAEQLKTAPLSSFTFYYDNDQDEDPYMYFYGFPASILYNLSE